VVLDNRETARRIGLRGQRFFVESLAHWYQNGPPPGVDDMDVGAHLSAMEAAKRQVAAAMGGEASALPRDLAGYFEEVSDSYGTVPDCIRYVGRLFDAGADEILFLIQMGTIPHAAVMQTIRNIGTHVIPHFRSQLTASRS
jgi:hypothetical protein